MILAVLFGGTGFYAGAYFIRSEVGAAVGALLGIFIGFLLAGRKVNKAKRSSYTGITIGTLLAIVGLSLSYIAYEPFQWQLRLVHDNGRVQNISKYKYKEECTDYITREFREYSKLRSLHPNARYAPFSNYQCTKFCTNNLDCFLKSL